MTSVWVDVCFPGWHTSAYQGPPHPLVVLVVGVTLDDISRQNDYNSNTKKIPCLSQCQHASSLKKVCKHNAWWLVTPGYPTVTICLDKKCLKRREGVRGGAREGRGEEGKGRGGREGEREKKEKRRERREILPHLMS